MKYAVYQINTERDKDRLLFMSFDATIRHAGKIDMEIYDKVYESEIRESYIGDQWTLEKIFEELNVRREKHPEFRGHSLSVSDVIELNGALWFCDSIGFRKFKQ